MAKTSAEGKEGGAQESCLDLSYKEMGGEVLSMCATAGLLRPLKLGLGLRVM